MAFVSLTLLGLALSFSCAVMVFRLRILRKPSILGTVFLVVFLMHGVTALPYSLGLLSTNLMPWVPVSPDFPMVMALTFAFFAAGAWGASAMFRLGNAEAQPFYTSHFRAGSLSLPVFIAASIAAGVLAVLYSYGVDSTTGLVLLAQSSREGDYLRDFRMGFRDANPYYYAGTLSRNALLPVLVLVAVNQAKATGFRSWRIAGYVLLGALVLMSLASLHKYPVIAALLYLIANRHLRGHGTGLAQTRMIAIAALLVGALGAAGYYLTYELSGQDALTSMLERIFVIPQESLNAFLEVYPHRADFNYGTGIGLVASTLGVANTVNPPSEVAHFIVGDPLVTFNALWTSEFWAAFGYPGVAIGSLLVGIILVALDRLCLRAPKTSVTVALYAFLIVASINVASTSIFTSILSGGLGVAPVVAVLLRGVGRAQREGLVLAR